MYIVDYLRIHRILTDNDLASWGNCPYFSQQTTNNLDNKQEISRPRSNQFSNQFHLYNPKSQSHCLSGVKNCLKLDQQRNM